MRREGTWLRRTLLYVILIAGLTPLHLRLYEYAFDDAYIHFRIAEHLVAHGVPYFNPGEAVMGSSSAGWTILLAVLLVVLPSSSLQTWAVLNSILTVSNVYIYAQILSRIQGTTQFRQELLAATLVLPVLLPSSIGLMETPAALLILGIAILLYLRPTFWAFAFFGMAVFFRLELVVFLAIFGVEAMWSRRFRLHNVIWATTIGVSPFVLFELAFFHSIIPNTMRAKSAGYSLGYLDSASILLRRGVFVVNKAIAIKLLCLVAAAWLALRRGYAALWRPESAVLGLIMLAGLTIAGAYVAMKTFVFAWYVPLFYLPIVFALAAIALQEGGYQVVGVVVLATISHQYYLAQTCYAATLDAGQHAGFHEGARVQQYLAVGGQLYTMCPECALMTSEIGGLGYAFRGRIVDGFGLVSPDALRFHPMKVPEERRSGTTGAIPVGYIREVKPEFIVSYDVFVEAFVRSDESKNYHRIRLPVFREKDRALARKNKLWGSEYLSVFVRADLWRKWSAAGVAPRVLEGGIPDPLLTHQ